jgi:type II secretory pathway pseudopilin PulG
MQNLNKIRGQALIEVVVAMVIGAIMIGTASGALFVILRSKQLAQNNQIASSLASALSDNLSSVAEANWHNIYDLNKGSANKYHVATSTGQLTVQSGEEQIAENNVIFTNYFYIENVQRDSAGNIVASGGTDDPSTQKAVITSSWIIGGSASVVTNTLYFTRWPNRIFQQTDWSGGPGQEGPVTLINNKFSTSEYIDFNSAPGSLTLTGAADEGELVSSIFDTQVTGGVGFNTIMWQGSLPADSKVKFKIASSNDPSQWNWAGQPYFIPAGPGVQEQIDQSLHNNKRYFRYKIILEAEEEESPRVDDVIISYSP